MNIAHSHEHDRALRQLTAYSAGLLPEADTLRVEEHLRECDDCRGRLASLKPLPENDPSHLPASLIATWPRATQWLSGIERSLVDSHLRSCDACRAALTFAGHEPVLPAVVVPPRRRTPRDAGRRAAWRWSLAVSGAAVAAAAWMLVVQPALFPRDTRTSATMGGLAGRGEEVVSFELSVPVGTPGALALPQGAPDGAPLLEVGPVPPGVGLVLLLPAGLRPATPEDGGRLVSLTLLRHGRGWGSRRCRLDALGEAVRVQPAAALPAGDYELRLSVATRLASDPPQVWRYTLRVR